MVIRNFHSDFDILAAIVFINVFFHSALGTNIITCVKQRNAHKLAITIMQMQGCAHTKCGIDEY